MGSGSGEWEEWDPRCRVWKRRMETKTDERILTVRNHQGYEHRLASPRIARASTSTSASLRRIGARIPYPRAPRRSRRLRAHLHALDPSPSENFLLSRNLAPALVTPEDIVLYSITDAEPVPVDPRTGQTWPGEAPRGFMERHILAGVYRRFAKEGAEGQQSVAHFHVPEVIPFGLLDPSHSGSTPFLPSFHMAGFLTTLPPLIFDLSQSFGPATDLLIRDAAQGDALASCFAPVTGQSASASSSAAVASAASIGIGLETETSEALPTLLLLLLRRERATAP